MGPLVPYIGVETRETFMRFTTLTILGSGLLLAACTSTGNIERGAVGGSAIGAAAGAIIGNNTGSGDAEEGAEVGAVVGAVAGAAAGRARDVRSGEGTTRRGGPRSAKYAYDEKTGRYYYYSATDGRYYYANGEPKPD